MQRIRRQVASDIRKGIVQRVELSTKIVAIATSHELEDAPNKSQYKGKNMFEAKALPRALTFTSHP